ncbi:hypothetical protein CRE_14143 [Caenorhabditis remanei]|uniref:Major sperm protein n=1 Tax=Caenorhabditis remanei TaxID=31234 RepID=E3MRH8_CAERE|nr:hypothetical protein CRE_14143 [Caenorhabditis remanei]
MSVVFAFIFLLVNTVVLSTILFQCATAKRSNQHENKSKKSTQSRKSSRSGKSSRSRKSSRSGRSTTSSKSGKSSRSGRSGKSGKSSKSKSVKSYKLKPNPKGQSNKKVQAAILADQKAAKDAINPSLKEVHDLSTSEKQMNQLVTKKEGNSKVSYTNIRVIPHEISFPQIGGLKHVRIKNSSGKRIVYMVKCSDNMMYSINPVYGIIENDKDAQINILRENGEAKYDKLVIITAVHTDKNKTAEQTFASLNDNNSHDYNINVVPLLIQ